MSELTRLLNSAFPVSWECGDGSYVQAFGLTKREEFAKAAMQGLLAARTNVFDHKETCRFAIAHADALIAQLSKESSK